MEAGVGGGYHGGSAGDAEEDLGSQQGLGLRPHPGRSVGFGPLRFLLRFAPRRLHHGGLLMSSSQGLISLGLMLRSKGLGWLN